MPPALFSVLTASPTPRKAPTWAAWLAFALFALALVRGAAMVGADPLVALANNYDQVRYTACFDLYPVRPGVDPAANNYQAPLETYAFQSVPGAGCYWTSDLVFQGVAAAVFRAHEALGGDASHSVRWLGLIRLAAWLAAVALVSLAFRRDGRPHLALANLVWLVALGLDPVNSIYLNTFYSEAGALFYAYLVVALATLAAVRATPLRLALLAVAAFALGMSKMQHLALPLGIAVAIAVAAAWRAPRLWRCVLALVVGGGLACAVQFAQMQRDGPMIGSIATANNLDFALTALLPASGDPARTAERIGLDRTCAAHVGKSIYTVGMPAVQACPGVDGLSRAQTLTLLATEPSTVLRMLAAAPAELLPWIPPYLGLVAGGNVAPLPDGYASVNRVFGKRTPLAWLFLLLPAVIVVVALVRGAGPTVLAFSAACTATALGVVVVSLYGDGIVELAKHSHLALNAGCACALALAAAALFRRALPHAAAI